MAKRVNCLTVKQLLKRLATCPPNAPVRFLNTDDPDAPAADIEAVDTVERFEKSLGHADAAKTVREAGLRRGEVVLTGVIR